ncbi:MAG: hypothetical protein KAS16_07030 [Thermoplasmata archaeon]|nr:hypothetical protein [Thermoplasmata archaeon]
MAKDFKCQSCGAPLRFEPDERGLKCEYCGSKEVIQVERKAILEHDIFSAPRATGWDVKVKAITCDSCGARTTADLKLSGNCAFCGSNFVKELEPDPNLIRPETLIPFAIDKDRALWLYKKWLGKGFFRPSNLKKLGRLKNIRGIYTPFWTYDCNAFSRWTAMSGYYYYVTETYRTSEGTKTRRVRKTRWVPSNGQRSGFYNDTLIPASRGLDPELATKIYPYHLDRLVPYTSDFLAGWQAEEYGIPLEEGWITAQRKVRGSERSACARDIPGDTHTALSVYTDLSNITYKHILLPVWVAAYKYKKKTYHFLVNGQTGEVQGHAPISWLKVAGIVLLVVSTLLAAWYLTGSG